MYSPLTCLNSFFPLGGPDGELAASMRYLSQRYTMPYKEVTGILTDIGTEELTQNLYRKLFHPLKTA